MYEGVDPMPDTAPTASASPIPIAPASNADAFSPPASLRPDHPVQTQARTELVRIAYRELRAGTLASAGAASAFALALALEMASMRLWAWLGFMLAVAGFRVWLAA